MYGLMNWKHQCFVHTTVRKTSWRFRIAILCALSLLLIPTRSLWLGSIGTSLTHQDPPAPADLLVLEYYTPNYLLFETAHGLIKSGVSRNVLIPVETPDPGVSNPVATEIARILASHARLADTIQVQVDHIEPITLNVARQVAKKIHAEGASSVILISPTFRSRRSLLVYRSVLEPMGINVQCIHPVESVGPRNWWHTLHGIQDVALELIKLQYYRFIVL